METYRGKRTIYQTENQIGVLNLSATQMNNTFSVLKPFIKIVKVSRPQFAANWGIYNGPKAAAVQILIKKFRERGSVINVKRLTRVRTGRSNENIAAVRDNVALNPQLYHNSTPNTENARYCEMLTSFFFAKNLKILI